MFLVVFLIYHKNSLGGGFFFSFIILRKRHLLFLFIVFIYKILNSTVALLGLWGLKLRLLFCRAPRTSFVPTCVKKEYAPISDFWARCPNSISRRWLVAMRIITSVNSPIILDDTDLVLWNQMPFPRWIWRAYLHWVPDKHLGVALCSVAPCCTSTAVLCTHSALS